MDLQTGVAARERERERERERFYITHTAHAFVRLTLSCWALPQPVPAKVFAPRQIVEWDYEALDRDEARCEGDYWRAVGHNIISLNKSSHLILILSAKTCKRISKGNEFYGSWTNSNRSKIAIHTHQKI